MFLSKQGTGQGRTGRHLSGWFGCEVRSRHCWIVRLFVGREHDNHDNNNNDHHHHHHHHQQQQQQSLLIQWPVAYTCWKPCTFHPMSFPLILPNLPALTHSIWSENCPKPCTLPTTDECSCPHWQTVQLNIHMVLYHLHECMPGVKMVDPTRPRLFFVWIWLTTIMPPAMPQSDPIASHISPSCMPMPGKPIWKANQDMYTITKWYEAGLGMIPTQCHHVQYLAVELLCHRQTTTGPVQHCLCMHSSNKFWNMMMMNIGKLPQAWMSWAVNKWPWWWWWHGGTHAKWKQTQWWPSAWAAPTNHHLCRLW